jgi:geranylgeranyl reductase family protein
MNRTPTAAPFPSAPDSADLRRRNEAARLESEEVVHPEYDLIVVGGGPAGSTLALCAGQRGLRTLLVEKAIFPRDKVCGDLIPTSSLSILSELELLDQVLRAPHAEISTLVLRTEHESVRLRGLNLVASARLVFDQILFQAAKARVDTLEGARVDGLVVEAGRVVGVCGLLGARRFRHTADVVAGADGAASIVARAAGLPAQEHAHLAVATRAYYRSVAVAEDEVEVHYLAECSPGYVWFIPVGDGIVNVGVGKFPGEPDESRVALVDLHHRMLRTQAVADRLARAEQLGPVSAWTLPLASKRRTMHGEGFILLGDAAGLVDPLWGHGIDAAMLSGTLAAAVLADAPSGARHRNEVLARYADAVWSEKGKSWASSLSTRRLMTGLRAFVGTTLLWPLGFDERSEL